MQRSDVTTTPVPFPLKVTSSFSGSAAFLYYWHFPLTTNLMDSIEREVTNYMVSTGDSSAEASQAAANIVQAVNTASVQANLLQLIQSMEEYLTSDDDQIRAKATGLLSHTLHKCDQQSINEAAVSVLVDFYCDRLTDRTCVPNLLEGLVALTSSDNFTGTNAVTTATRIFERVEIQRFPQATRNTAFHIFENLMDRHLSALKAINNEFVYGFTQSMDGEKDPRNLMAAFKLVKLIVQHFDIGAHVEDLFEVTFCYFPITFKPPPDDPYGITADDLKQSLRQCISSTGLFAKLALPLILEKLSSTSGSAKKDSMETLAACAPVYGANVLLPVIDEIFDALKVEVFHSTDQALEDAALVGIESVVATLSAGLAGNSGETIEKTLKPLVVECIANLKEPELKNTKPAGRILRAASSASYAACASIINAVVPLLLRQYRETEIATRRKAIMDVILEFLEASKSLYGAADGDVDMDQTEVSPLIEYKDRFFGIFESAITSSNEYNGLRLSGLKGLELMVLTKNFLSQNERGIGVQAFNKILLEETDEELRTAALASLKEILQFDTKYIVEETVPFLMKRLPDSAKETQQISYKQTLTALKVLCPEPSLFKAAIPPLLQKFDKVCATDNDPAYPCAILRTLLSILEVKVMEKHTDISPCIDTLVPHFIVAAINASLDTSKKQMILQNDVLENVALVIMIVVESLKSDAQKPFVDRMFKLYLHGDLSQLNIQGSGFEPFKDEPSNVQKATTQLFAAVVAACRRDINFPVTSIEDFLTQLVDITLVSTDEIQQVSLVRIIGSLINKWRDAAATTKYVENLAARLETIISQNATNYVNALNIYLWIARALVLRSHQLGYKMTDTVIGWCANPTLGKQASKGFDIIIGDDQLALNKASFAIMAILYKQRFFTDSLPKLVDGFRNSPSDIKHNYLIALSYLLKNVPKQILLSELPPLVPLLIESLPLPDTTLKVSTLDTFRLAIADAPDAIAPHVRSIIPALLELLDTTNQQNPMDVRIAVLKCLAQFPLGLTNDILQPHARFVTKQLVKPLDDRKRLVRKEAVECRAKWYTVIS
ncbi:RNAPII transcription regulator C-terminal-domain-containing protein [Phascolomyces articulosus]|uniref:MMS19 nucleotide excision repair protein n=1 Tax=Phascolomyces articulosus TaxID=60185 RepID=A0AAD5K9C6_9FUNG|nr:RNAPII transcription regulator C-terminal-domain-containing protein [Phascolomyces articulosus]